VAIAARHRQLQVALYTAGREFEEARGTPREFDALCRWSAAERELDAYEAKMRLVSELSAAVRRSRAGNGTVGPWKTPTGG
jgi:hypothetical protein